MKILLEQGDLRPLIEAIVKETLNMLQETGSFMGDRIAYTESEAAALLGLAQHVLRDRRLEGQVSASRVGRGYMYQRSDLIRMLERNRICP